MKKILVIMLSVIIICFTGCGKKYDPLPNAEELLNQIKKSVSTIGRIEAFDESSDPNGKLGRPGEYISKADFEDTRIDQIGEYLIGGTLETFENSSDCIKRYEYLKSLQDPSLGAFGVTQYIYKYDNVLLRIEYDLTPEQAQEYHARFDEIMSKYQDIKSQKADTSE